MSILASGCSTCGGGHINMEMLLVSSIYFTAGLFHSKFLPYIPPQVIKECRKFGAHEDGTEAFERLKDF